MKSLRTGMRLLIAAGLLVCVPYSVAGDDSKEKVFHARLDGAHETPSISTLATGSFRATLNAAATSSRTSWSIRASMAATRSLPMSTSDKRASPAE